MKRAEQVPASGNFNQSRNVNAPEGIYDASAAEIPSRQGGVAGKRRNFNSERCALVWKKMIH